MELTDGDFIGQTLRDVPIARLRPRQFMQLKADLVATRSHTVALKVWSTLRSALDYAVVMEWVDFNTAASIKIDRQRRVAPEDRVPIPCRADIATIHQALQRRPGEPLTFGQVSWSAPMPGTRWMRPSQRLASATFP